MQTKYVRAHNGLFALFSEGLGIQHSAMADHIADARSMSDAGFVYLTDEKRFGVYGKSLTLGIGADKSAADEMNAVIDRGELRLYPYGDAGFIATNAQLSGEFEIATDVSVLLKQRVFARMLFDF